MPQIITKDTNNNSVAETEKEPEFEIMRNITYITKEFGMSFREIMELPYSVFLSYLKWARIFQLEQTEKGRDALYMESTINKTEPDLKRLRNLDGYQAKIRE